MQSLQKNYTYTCRTQVNTQNHLQKRIEVTSCTRSKIEHNCSSPSKPLLSLWHISFPLCVVLIAAIGSLTAHSMVKGRYLFDLSISKERIRIQTDVDKREGIHVGEKEWIGNESKTH